MLCLQSPVCHLTQSHPLHVSDPLETASYHSNLLREKATVMKAAQNDTVSNLPHSVLMPDGEELPPGSFTHAQIRCSNQENELINPCLRPPPNRTVFSDTSSSPPSRSHSCGALEEEKNTTGSNGSIFNLISSWMNGKLKEKDPSHRCTKEDKGVSRNRCSSMSNGTSNKKSSPVSNKCHLIPTPMFTLEPGTTPMCVQVPCKSRATKKSPVRTDPKTFPNSASSTASSSDCIASSLRVHSSPVPIRHVCDNITNSELLLQSSASVKVASLPVVQCFTEGVPQDKQKPSFPV
ncbi:hypothetical protein QYM36_001644 [Artemia franciscana]|uniref:Uncharacterized protein n=2 Tax=Artemia franciscana TaxID=6661 RepID=A0AA88LFY3_ARTSF|nr:hypothetical protein QYM36_001644 [Artemia franciscana]